jgi:hypothetical protein
MKYEFMDEQQIIEQGFRKLQFKINDRDAYVLIEHKNHLVYANLYIWGPAYECYFLKGAIKYQSLEALEENMEKEIKEEVQTHENYWQSRSLASQ